MDIKIVHSEKNGNNESTNILHQVISVQFLFRVDSLGQKIYTSYILIRTSKLPSKWAPTIDTATNTGHEKT